MMLNAEQYKYTLRRRKAAGFHILIHDQGVSNTLMSNQGINVNCGAEINIAMSLTNVSVMPTCSYDYKCTLHMLHEY